MHAHRLIFGALLFLSATLLPLFVTMTLTLFGFFLFPRFWEAVGLALFVELLYRGGGAGFLGFPIDRKSTRLNSSH